MKELSIENWGSYEKKQERITETEEKQRKILKELNEKI